MGKIKVTKEELATGKLFTPGEWYRVRVVDYNEKLSKDKESTNHVFKLVCVPNGNPEHDAFVGASPGVVFNEKAIGRIGPFFGACGATMTTDGGYDVDPNWCKGKEIEVFVEHREGEKKGQVYNDCKDFRPAPAL